MSKKALISILTLLIIFALGAGFWRWENQKKIKAERQNILLQQNQVEVKKTEEEGRQITQVDEKFEQTEDGWKKYQSKKYAFAVAVPDDWSLRIAEDAFYENGVECYYFEKNQNSHLAICPKGGFGQGIGEPLIKYEKFKGRDAKMFFYNGYTYPGFIFLLKNFPSSWNLENRIEFIGTKKDMDVMWKIYDNFQFIE